MKGIDWRKLFLGMVAVSGVAASCTQDFGAFQFDEPSGAGAGTPTTTSTTMGECSSPDQCPDAGVCKLATCIDGKCGVTPATAGATCSDAGGIVCDGFGACVECNKNSDCPAEKPNCSAKQCIPNPCMNGVLDGDETDIDCGGASCPKCTAGDDCLAPTDCDSNFCKPAGGGSGGAGGSGGSGGAGGAGGAAPSGPGICQPCEVDGACASDEYCKDKTTCTPKFQQATACGADAECLSGFCTDGVCCNARCDETCAACVNVKTGQNEGECAPIPQGDDPDTECVDTAPELCGPETGKGCSGTTGSCDVWPSSTSCITASCNTAKNEQTAAANCDGAGSCPSAVVTSCGDYVCNNAKTACLTTCATDKEQNCDLDAYCMGDKCRKCGPNDPPGQATPPAGCSAGSTEKLCLMNCTGSACSNQFVCPQGYDCTVLCDNNNVCKDSTITCPDEYSCTISCGATSSCDNMTVIPGKGGTLKVTCGDFTDSCKNADINCGVNKCDVVCAGASKPKPIIGCGSAATDSCACVADTCK